MILSVLLVPVFAENETVAGGEPGSIDLLNGPPVIVAPVETQTLDTTAPIGIPTTQLTTAETPTVTTGPTTVPTIAELTAEPTAVPTEQPTTAETPTVTTGPTVVPTTAEVTAEPTAVPTTQPTIATVTNPQFLDNSTEFQGPAGNGSVINSIVPADVVPFIPVTSQNATIELNQSSGNSQAGGFDLSWTANLTDPPLNDSNLQGSVGSQYWEINSTTGSGEYPLDLGGLLTNSWFGIWIHGVSNVLLDGRGHTVEYNGPLNSSGVTGVVIEDSSNVQIVNLTLLGWDTGISILNSNHVYVSDNTTVTGNWNGGSGGTTGSGIVARDSSDVFIVSDLSNGYVKVENNGLDGILFDNVIGGQINNTYVANNGQNGVNLTSSQGITVENVTATGNFEEGFYLNQANSNNLHHKAMCHRYLHIYVRYHDAPGILYRTVTPKKGCYTMQEAFSKGLLSEDDGNRNKNDYRISGLWLFQVKNK